MEIDTPHPTECNAPTPEAPIVNAPDQVQRIRTLEAEVSMLTEVLTQIVQRVTALEGGPPASRAEPRGLGLGDLKPMSDHDRRSVAIKAALARKRGEK